MTNGPLIVDGILANVSQEDSIPEHNILQKNLGFIMWGGWSAISSPIINRRALGCCRNIWHIVLPTEATLCKKKDPSLRCQDEHKIAWVVKMTMKHCQRHNRWSHCAECWNSSNNLHDKSSSFQTRPKFSFKILTKLQSLVVNQNLSRSYASRLRFLLRKTQVDSDFSQIIWPKNCPLEAMD